MPHFQVVSISSRCGRDQVCLVVHRKRARNPPRTQLTMHGRKISVPACRRSPFGPPDGRPGAAGRGRFQRHRADVRSFQTLRKRAGKQGGEHNYMEYNMLIACDISRRRQAVFLGSRGGGVFVLSIYSINCYGHTIGRIWSLGRLVGRFTIPAHGWDGVSDDYVISIGVDISGSIYQAA